MRGVPICILAPCDVGSMALGTIDDRARGGQSLIIVGTVDFLTLHIPNFGDRRIHRITGIDGLDEVDVGIGLMALHMAILSNVVVLVRHQTRHGNDTFGRVPITGPVIGHRGDCVFPRLGIVQRTVQLPATAVKRV